MGSINLRVEMKGPIKLSRCALLIIIGANLGLFVVMTLVLVCFYFRRIARKAHDGKPAKRYEESTKPNSYSQQLDCEDRGKLMFLEGPKQFELDDLLRASAEMLGKGSFGSAYRAALEDSTVVVVKRLKDVDTGGRRDFEQYMQLLGTLKHANLLSLRAYYYAKDERLLVYDYLPNGNLYALLHGNKTPATPSLDWKMRVKIALDAATGLTFLHDLSIIHGNVKSSNILVDRNGNACLGDCGLVGLMNPSMAFDLASRSVGYIVPGSRRLSEKTDVYSFGVVLLEVLTGKNPSEARIQGPGGHAMDLPQWVQSVVREEWTVEVFDLELMKYHDIEEEMVGMLQIALACASPTPDQRPKMCHVVKMISDIRGGGDTDQSATPYSATPTPSSAASPFMAPQ